MGALSLVPALASALLLLHTAAAAPFSQPLLRPRGAVDFPTADWGDAGNIYRSTDLYACGPYPLTLYGRFGPFSVDVVDFENRTVLQSLGGGWPAGNFSYIPDLPKGTKLVMRVTDTEGNEVLSSEKKVKDGERDKPTKKGKRKEKLIMTAIGVGIASPFILGLLCCCFSCCCRRVPKRDEDVELAQPAEPYETAARRANGRRPGSPTNPLKEPLEVEVTGEAGYDIGEATPPKYRGPPAYQETL